MPRSFCSLVIVMLCLLPAAGSHAGLKVLDGELTVIYDIVNPRGVAFIPDYSNESFTQKVLSQDEFSKRVQAISRMHPMKSRVPYPIPAGSVPGALRQYLNPEGVSQ